MGVKKISILGSTGSIGKSTLDICRQHAERFKVVALAAGKNVDLLLSQIREFKPQLVSVATEPLCRELQSVAPGVTVCFGEEGACAVASCAGTDLVVSALVGAMGLKPTLGAIERGSTVALANKESMVIAGSLMSKRARERAVKILPVDSEHSAIFQCLNGEHHEDVKRLILTASGGPFLKTPAEDFSHITVKQALNHPNWDMGEKITIDSATMMNKGLEIIEARWLFDMLVEKISVVIHPQSVVHSMVEFIDGSVLAQLGEPDMRSPIAYALSYPRRITTQVKPVDLPAREKLTFYQPDLEKFRCLKFGFDAAQAGRSCPAVLNAANEVAVAAFLNGRISFTQIPQLIDLCLQKHVPFDLDCVEDVLRADQWGRQTAEDAIKNL